MSGNLKIRSIIPEELKHFIELELRPFGRHPSDEFLWGEKRIHDSNRALVATIDGDIVGTTSSHRFKMAVPGGVLPAAGVCGVGVMPTHRRKGILTQLMNSQLEKLHERDEPVSLLWASESAIFERFGYGMAGIVESWSIDRRNTAFDHSPPNKGLLKYVELEEARLLFPNVYERVWRNRPGMLRRHDALWDLRFLDSKEYRHGADPFFFVIYEINGTVDGYVIFRVNWREGYLEVMELLAATDEAHAALWRFCFDHDRTETVKAINQPVDDPVPWMLANPRRLVRTPRDGIWVRLVDVTAALSTRTYAVQGRIVLEVSDPICEWNQRRVELQGGPDGADCRTTRKEPNLILSAADLAAMYLGAARASILCQAGRVHADDPETLKLANAMFAVERQPWCGDRF